MGRHCKIDSRRKVDRYKARLVAKEWNQTYKIDYDKTFAPVEKISIVRTLIFCVENFGWPLHYLDVKNTFLHGDLQENVYIEILSKFISYHTLVRCVELRSHYIV